jgi:hypothetical protein
MARLCDRPRRPPDRHRRIHHPHDLRQQGKAALFLKEGKLIAPPRDPRFADRQAINQALLKTAEELDLPELAARLSSVADGTPTRQGLHAASARTGAVAQPVPADQGNASGIWLGVTSHRKAILSRLPGRICCCSA